MQPIELMKLCDSSNTKLHLISTGSSRANSQVVRVMPTLRNMLTTVELNKDKSWQQAVGDIPTTCFKLYYEPHD